MVMDITSLAEPGRWRTSTRSVASSQAPSRTRIASQQVTIRRFPRSAQEQQGMVAQGQSGMAIILDEP